MVCVTHSCFRHFTEMRFLTITQQPVQSYMHEKIKGFIDNNQKYTKLSIHYYKTGHAVSFSSIPRMEPTKLPTHVKGAWQVTLSRWPNRERELVLDMHPHWRCMSRPIRWMNLVIHTLFANHWGHHALMEDTNESCLITRPRRPTVCVFLLTTRKWKRTLQHQTMPAIDLQSVYSYLLQENGNLSSDIIHQTMPAVRCAQHPPQPLHPNTTHGRRPNLWRTI